MVKNILHFFLTVALFLGALVIYYNLVLLLPPPNKDWILSILLYTVLGIPAACVFERARHVYEHSLQKRRFFSYRVVKWFYSCAVLFLLSCSIIWITAILFSLLDMEINFQFGMRNFLLILLIGIYIAVLSRDEFIRSILKKILPTGEKGRENMNRT